MTTRPHPESERPLRGPLQSFDLDTEVNHLREEKAWQRADETRSRCARARSERSTAGHEGG